MTPLVARADSLDPGVSDELRLDLLPPIFESPTGGVFLPDGRLLVIEQGGDVELWEGGQDTRTLGHITTVSGGERGLLGVAVDPMFVTSRRIYLYYSTGGSQTVGYVTLDPKTDAFDAEEIEVLITGLSAGANHVGGSLAFGPDDLLYIGVGDRGCNCDCQPGENTTNYFATCLNKLHGKILRIDRDGGIPQSNPLVDVDSVPACSTEDTCEAASLEPSKTPAAPRTELYNWGLRNPWRFAFDEQTGYLWIGDVGERTFEEITISTGPGQHHGWPWREGFEGQSPTRCAITNTATSSNCKDPAFAYDHEGSGASITGGVFSNHCSWPKPWNGRYFFGDAVDSQIWAIDPNTERDGITGDRILVVTSGNEPVHFVRGPDGGIYYFNLNGDGSLWRITPSNPTGCPGVDAGPIVDAGTPDLGIPGDPDGGLETDAGEEDGSIHPLPDASVDSGTTNPLGDDDSGCGCKTTTSYPEGSLGLVLLAVVLLLRRRLH